MKDKLEFESCGLSGFVANVPENSTEYNNQAKAKGNTASDPCLDAAVNQALYHKVLGSWRSDLMDRVVEVTGVAPLTKDHPDGKKDAKGEVLKVIAEKPEPYIERVRALITAVKTNQKIDPPLDKDLRKHLKDLPDTVLQDAATFVSQGDNGESKLPNGEPKWPAYSFDDFIGATQRGERVPPKTYVEDGRKLIAQGPEKLRISLSKLAQQLGKPPLEVVMDGTTIVKPTPEDIAWAIQEMMKAQRTLLAA